jgi:hypothetical protein
MLIDVSNMLMALRTHNVPCEHLKYDFGDVDEAMFHDIESTFERIFYILGIQKSAFENFAEVMF